MLIFGRIVPLLSILLFIFQGDYFFIDDGPYLDSLEYVIEHYSLMSDGLPTTLQFPVPPMPKPPVPEMPPSLLLNEVNILKNVIHHLGRIV